MGNFRSVSPERKLASNLIPEVVQNTEAQPISVAVTLHSEEAEVGTICGENNTPKRTIVKKTIPVVDSKLLQSQNTNFRSVSPERKLASNLIPEVVQNTA